MGSVELSTRESEIAFFLFIKGLFEGLKAYRKEDRKIQLFRPDQNALRMQAGAERLCMPSPSVEQFLDAVKQTVLANKHWVYHINLAHGALLISSACSCTILLAFMESALYEI